MDTSNSISQGHIKYLDGWRGIAVLSLLFGHFTSFDTMGQFGVEVFFVLSGRLMADILFVRKLDLKTFFFRRASRIWPALLVFSLALFLVSLIGQEIGFKTNHYVHYSDFQAAILFYMNYYVLTHQETVLAHTWSIAVEEHAYVLLALVAFLTKRSSKKAIGILALISVCCAVNGIYGSIKGGGEHDLYWRSDVRLSSVLISSTIFLTGFGRLSTWGPLPCLTFIAALSFEFDVIPLAARYTLGTICLAIAVNTLAAAPPVILRVLEARPLTFLGTLSFSIYLWQQPFYLVSGRLPAAFNGPLCILAIVVGAASYYYLENPVRIWLNAAWRRSVAKTKADAIPSELDVSSR
ncbi:acyltransferase [Bradyrhizobium sp. 15]|uniref:acyltransferase family protein n=1 Tax=Bradyrhizobium sp. 15 TaxID=2782633 RepID=UPI001FF9A878|nr:acyltransferase [Bradyrhizobium sp. 15]MCK1434954.1 acyltransferase [Bradyrhizobium sp. 15]